MTDITYLLTPDGKVTIYRDGEVAVVLPADVTQRLARDVIDQICPVSRFKALQSDEAKSAGRWGQFQALIALRALGDESGDGKIDDGWRSGQLHGVKRKGAVR